MLLPQIYKIRRMAQTLSTQKFNKMCRQVETGGGHCLGRLKEGAGREDQEDRERLKEDGGGKDQAKADGATDGSLRV